MKCFLHIGLHKTGSTAIQNTLKNFDDGSIVYADLGWANHSIPIYTAFSRNFLEYPIWKRQGLTVAKIERLRQTARAKLENSLRRGGRDALIISGEGISKLDRYEMSELADTIGCYCKEICVLVYVRNPYDLAASQFQENVKAGGFRLDLGFSQRARERIETAMDVFGENSVFVRNYTSGLRGGDVISDFCSWVGIRSIPDSSFRTNQSLRADALKVLFVFNQGRVVSHGSKTLLDSRSKLIRALNEAAVSSGAIPREPFYEKADVSDLEYLRRKFEINYYRPSRQTEGTESDHLSDWLSQVGVETIDGMAELLKRSGFDYGHIRDPGFLAERLYLHIHAGNISICEGIHAP